MAGIPAAVARHHRRLARRYPVDALRVTLVGHSAGAHFPIWAASRSKLPADSDVRGAAPLRPSAAVVIDGPPSLARFLGADTEECGEPVIVPLIGGTPTQVPQRYRDADAAARLPLGISQPFLVSTLGDTMTNYVAAARAAVDPVIVYKPAEPYHFRIVNPERPEGQQTLALVERMAKAPPRR